MEYPPTEEQNFHLLKVKALFSILHLLCQFSFSCIQNCTIIFIGSAADITVIIYCSSYGLHVVTSPSNSWSRPCNSFENILNAGNPLSLTIKIIMKEICVAC
jgi:hypothetical protein